MTLGLRGVATATAATLGAVLGWAPWLRSGRRDYDLYELARVARDLDLVDASWQRALLNLAFALPLLAGAAWMAWALHRPRVAAGLALVTAATLLVAAIQVGTAELPSRGGVPAAIVLSTLTAALAAHTIRGPAR